jgi:hypothetical protein
MLALYLIPRNTIEEPSKCYLATNNLFFVNISLEIIGYQISIKLGLNFDNDICSLVLRANVGRKSSQTSGYGKLFCIGNMFGPTFDFRFSQVIQMKE